VATNTNQKLAVLIDADKAQPAKPVVEVAQLPALRPMILTAIDAVARDDGWAPLGPVGSQMSKNNPSFDPRNYGFAQLGKLMRKQDYLEIKEVPMGEGSTHVHL
jgi:hypothetical protein